MAERLQAHAPPPHRTATTPRQRRTPQLSPKNRDTRKTLCTLEWREIIGINCLWGGLSPDNQTEFPAGSYAINRSKPYFKLRVGVHNIFKLLHVEYVRRLNYNDLPGVNKNSVRFVMRATF